MIVGHGVDILEKVRFNNLFDKYKKKLIAKCFLYDEINENNVILVLYRTPKGGRRPKTAATLWVAAKGRL